MNLERGIPTYHVVPRFDIAAEDGPLTLGTIVDDLKLLVPLNRGQHPIAKPYKPTTQIGFSETRAKIIGGGFMVWARALVEQGIGVSASISGSNNVAETISCASVVTTYFDPSRQYVDECLQAQPIQEYLEGSDSRSADIYMITGLKVAKDLKFSGSAATNAQSELKAGVQLPQVPAVMGQGGTLGKNVHQAVKFGADDIVVGFRVSQYRVRRRLWRKRVVENKGIVQGQMWGYEEEGYKQYQTEFEEVPVPEEVVAQEEARNAGVLDECWVA